jgi:glutamyl-tRNA synthetase
MTVRTRFAPSPTGLLHVGNVRTALVAWLFARKAGGEFFLRIDDTDDQRSTNEFVDQIKEDLLWLGLRWDELFHQKDRVTRYGEVKDQLIDQGRLYPCFETAEELSIKRKSQLTQGEPPIYDRSALRLTDQQIEVYIQEGRKPHYRFKLENKPTVWQDLVQGEVKFESISVSDPVVLREDGTWTYMLCSVIDDVDFNMTHIVRGDDHINNTAVQIQMFEALGVESPTFAHLPRITSKEEKISKRVGGFDIKTLREREELEPMTINNFLSCIGTSGEISSYLSLDDLIASFDITQFHKSPTTYIQEDMVRVNHKIIAQMTVEQASAVSGEEIRPELWSAVRSNLHRLSEVKIWDQVCYGNIDPVVEEGDREFLSEAAKLLPDMPWTEETWSVWVGEIKVKLGRTGKSIFMPIRIALTGTEHGPELKYLLPILGQERVLKRLNGIAG